MISNRPALETLAVHAGHELEPVTGAVVTPIFATSTYARPEIHRHSGFEYSRSHNPTRYALERAIAELESGKRGFAFASGLAALSTLLDLLPHGAHVVACDDLYGGSRRLFEQVRARSAGLRFTFLGLADPNAINQIPEDAAMVFIESPTNPTMSVLDLKKIVDRARDVGAISVVDNTFATPIIQRPLELGFDLVLHSATKYLAGHSDLIAGLVVARDATTLGDRVGYLQNAVGAVLGPFDSFLVTRGIRTLALRMERHSQNALAIAKHLEGKAGVTRVFYPGLESHPQHAVAKRQMAAFGGMISFEVEGGLSRANLVLQKMKLFFLAESLGGVESLVEHPGGMTHAAVPKDVRDTLGISDGLIRLSVGIEHQDDLIRDLDQALAP